MDQAGVERKDRRHHLLENADACETDCHQVGELVLVCGRVHDPTEVDPVEGLQGVDDDKPVGGLEFFRVPYTEASRPGPAC